MSGVDVGGGVGAEEVAGRATSATVASAASASHQTRLALAMCTARWRPGRGFGEDLDDVALGDDAVDVVVAGDHEHADTPQASAAHTSKRSAQGASRGPDRLRPGPFGPV
jgi:hypothetical protein